MIVGKLERDRNRTESGKFQVIQMPVKTREWVKAGQQSRAKAETNTLKLKQSQLQSALPCLSQDS